MLIGTGVMAVTLQGLCGPMGRFTPPRFPQGTGDTSKGWTQGTGHTSERWPKGRFLYPPPDLASQDTNHCGSCQSIYVPAPGFPAVKGKQPRKSSKMPQTISQSTVNATCSCIHIGLSSQLCRALRIISDTVKQPQV